MLPSSQNQHTLVSFFLSSLPEICSKMSSTLRRRAPKLKLEPVRSPCLVSNQLLGKRRAGRRAAEHRDAKRAKPGAELGTWAEEKGAKEKEVTETADVSLGGDCNVIEGASPRANAMESEEAWLDDLRTVCRELRLKPGTRVWQTSGVPRPRKFRRTPPVVDTVKKAVEDAACNVRTILDGLQPDALRKTGLEWLPKSCSTRGSYGKCYSVRVGDACAVLKVQQYADIDTEHHLGVLQEWCMDRAAELCRRAGETAHVVPEYGHVEWPGLRITRDGPASSPPDLRGILSDVPTPPEHVWPEGVPRCGSDVPWMKVEPLDARDSMMRRDLILARLCLEGARDTALTHPFVCRTLAATASTTRAAQHVFCTVMPPVGTNTVWRSIIKNHLVPAEVMDIVVMAGLAVASVNRATNVFHNDLQCSNVMWRRLKTPALYIWDIPYGKKWARLSLRSSIHASVIDWGLAGRSRGFADPADSDCPWNYVAATDDMDMLLTSLQEACSVSDGPRAHNAVALERLRQQWRVFMQQPWNNTIRNLRSTSGSEGNVPPELVEGKRDVSPRESGLAWPTFLVEMCLESGLGGASIAIADTLPPVEDGVHQVMLQGAARDALWSACAERLAWLDDVALGGDIPHMHTRSRQHVLSLV